MRKADFTGSMLLPMVVAIRRLTKKSPYLDSFLLTPNRTDHLLSQLEITMNPANLLRISTSI